jgi:hypothetical protein
MENVKWKVKNVNKLKALIANTQIYKLHSIKGGE